MLSFWLVVISVVFLLAGGAATAWLAGSGKSLDELPAWRRELRLGLFPKLDATPERLAEMEKYEAARAAHVRNEAVISAIYNASATGRG